MVIIRNYLNLDLKIGKVSREKILSDHVSITTWMKKNNDSATTLMKEIIKNLFEDDWAQMADLDFGLIIRIFPSKKGLIPLSRVPSFFKKWQVVI